MPCIPSVTQEDWGTSRFTVRYWVCSELGTRNSPGPWHLSAAVAGSQTGQAETLAFTPIAIRRPLGVLVFERTRVVPA